LAAAEIVVDDQNVLPNRIHRIISGIAGSRGEFPTR